MVDTDEMNDMITDPNDLSMQGNPGPEDMGYEPPQDIAPEEIPEDLPDDYQPGDPEPEPEPIAAEEKPKLPKISIKTRINQLNREKYQALEIAERIQQENEALRRELQNAHFQAQESAKAAMNFYDNSAELRLEQATKRYEEAAENGDIQAQSKAQREIAAVAAEIEQSKSWKAQQAYQEEQRKRYQPESYPQAPQSQATEPVSSMAKEWLISNPWFDERTKYYNPQLAAEIQNFSDELEDHFLQNGMAHKIGNSPEYFNAINMRANELQRSGYAQPNKQRGEIPMRSSRTPVAPVRSNSGYVRQTPQSPDLTNAEKFWAKQFGVKESEYQKYRDDDIRSGHRAYRSGYR